MNRITCCSKLFLSAVLAVLSTAGCAASPRLDGLADFARVDQDDTPYVYRVANAKGVVVGIREQANEPRGSLAFWSDVLSHKLTARGYTALGNAKSISTVSGREGSQLRYSISSEGRDHEYWLTIFVAGDNLVLVEASGDREVFASVAKELERAVASLDLG